MPAQLYTRIRTPAAIIQFHGQKLLFIQKHYYFLFLKKIN
jgi:hypothetical protein